VTDIVAKGTEHKGKFGKISQEQIDVRDVGEQERCVHD
jgi:hypothetical protein